MAIYNVEYKEARFILPHTTLEVNVGIVEKDKEKGTIEILVPAYQNLEGHKAIVGGKKYDKIEFISKSKQITMSQNYRYRLTETKPTKKSGRPKKEETKE